MTESPERHRKVWTEKEEAHLHFYWGIHPPERLAKDLKRTPWGVVQHAIKLKLGPFARGTMSLRELEKFSGFSIPKIKQALNKLGIKVPRVRRSDPTFRRTAEYAIDDDVAEKVVQYMIDNPLIYADKKGSKQTTRGAWGVGVKAAACSRCGRSDKPHYAKNYCEGCYRVVFNMKDEYVPTGNAAGKKYWEEPILSAEKVEEMRWSRFKENTSYSELARRYGVSRTSISRICKGKDWKKAGGPIEPYTHNNVWER